MVRHRHRRGRRRHRRGRRRHRRGRARRGVGRGRGVRRCLGLGLRVCVGYGLRPALTAREGIIGTAPHGLGVRVGGFCADERHYREHSSEREQRRERSSESLEHWWVPPSGRQVEVTPTTAPAAQRDPCNLFHSGRPARLFRGEEQRLLVSGATLARSAGACNRACVHPVGGRGRFRAGGDPCCARGCWVWGRRGGCRRSHIGAVGGAMAPARTRALRRAWAGCSVLTNRLRGGCGVPRRADHGSARPPRRCPLGRRLGPVPSQPGPCRV